MSTSTPRIPPPAAVVTILRDIGASVRTARLRRRWSQGLLAEKMGVSPMTVRNLEQGKPGVALATAIGAIWALGLERLLEPLTDPTFDRDGIVLEGSRLGKRARRTKRLNVDF